MRSDGGTASVITKEEASEIVSRSGWLAHRPARFREQVLAHTRLVTFAKGTAIYRIGDPPNGVYGLVEGLLRIEVVIGGLGEQVAFVARPGFWIGVAAIMHRHERKVTVIAASDSWLLSLPPAAFETLAADAENTRQFASMINENNDVAMAVARDLMNPDMRARIASRLLAIFGRSPDGAGSDIGITQADLATLCNVSRKTINRELAELARIGAISRSYGRLVLLDPARLARVADGDRRPAKARRGDPTSV
jgi:CRP-like cAMP-binding protein